VVEPDGFVRPAFGTRIQLAGIPPRAAGEVLVLHFLNPDCPCSRFNVEHIRALQRQLTVKQGQVLRFVAVLQGDRTPGQLLQAFQDLRLPMEAVVDVSGEVGRAVGIFSTPQAAVVDSDHRLYFRGNYNSSRYCTLSDTQFVRIAIEALLSGLSLPALPKVATTPYGCPLPRKNKTKNESLASI